MSTPTRPAKGAKRGLVLTGLLFVVYFVFIGLVAFAPGFMRRPAIGVVSFGLVAAPAVIVFALLLTVLYVWLGNMDDRA